MRIRKRFPTASVALADPKLNRSLVVQVHPHTAEQNPHGNHHFQECKTNSQPSDPPNQPSDQGMPIPGEKHRWVSSHGASTEDDILVKMKQKDLEDDRYRWVEEEKNNSNDIRKECTLNAEVDISLLLSSSSSSDPDGRWGEGDKVVPLKKRKGGLERIIANQEINSTNNNTVNTKWKSKTNKKCLMQNSGGDGNEHELKEKLAIEDDDASGNISTKAAKKKKKKRGNVIMEGSRCSRVNGRGWRCCQQTLVGYSLCEHHLGKGRLRSMSSVRNRAASANNSAIAPIHLVVDDDDDHKSSPAPPSLGESYKHKNALLMDHDNGEKPTMITTKMMEKKKKKKKKLGTVKARSMSSLLGQTDNIAVVTANTPN